MQERFSPSVQRLLQTITEVTGHDVALLQAGSQSGKGTVTWPIRDKNGDHDHGFLAVTPGDRPIVPSQEELYVQLTELIADEIELREVNLSLESRFRLLDRQNAELAAINRALSDMAYRDPVTRLYQRWYFLEQLKLEGSRAARHGKIFSILIVNLDRFEELKERHGHGEADRVLRSFAHLLQQSSRTSDVVCRFGGDEFGLLLNDTPADGAAEVAGRILKRCNEEPHTLSDDEVIVTCSIGSATFEGIRLRLADASPEVMIEQAARSTHRARQAGGNRAEFAIL
jgi:diguanylate cyclase (GGDEF)-like protein